MRTVVFLLFSFLVFDLLAQEPPLKLTLEEAIDYAIKNNRSAASASLDIEAAKKQKWETTAIGLPQLEATVDYQNFLKQPVSLIPAEFFGGMPGEFSEVQFGTQQNVVATATLKQLLFDGSYLVGLQSAKVFLEISKNAKIKTDLEVRKLVIEAYGNALLAEESVTIFDKNKTTIDKTLGDTQKTFENGLTEEEDVEQLQITAARVNSNLNNSKRLRNIAYKLLNTVLGTNDINTRLILDDDLQEITTGSVDLPLIVEEFNSTQNIDYLIARNDRRSKELLLKFEKTKALPTLNAFINGGYSGFNDSFRFLESGQQWFGSSLFGVSLNIPLFSSFQRSAATQRAKINFEKADLQLTETEMQVRLQLETARSNYSFAIEEYETSVKNLALAERIEGKNQTKYTEGLASSFELNEAQNQLYAAQQSYLRAMQNVINNKAELETILHSDLTQKNQ